MHKIILSVLLFTSSFASMPEEEKEQKISPSSKTIVSPQDAWGDILKTTFADIEQFQLKVHHELVQREAHITLYNLILESRNDLLMKFNNLSEELKSFENSSTVHSLRTDNQDIYNEVEKFQMMRVGLEKADISLQALTHIIQNTDQIILAYQKSLANSQQILENYFKFKKIEYINLSLQEMKEKAEKDFFKTS